MNARDRNRKVAQHLCDVHRSKERFGALPAGLAPRSLADAYAMQDAFVALKSRHCGAIVGRKIALTTDTMRRMVGLDDSIAGTLLARQVVRAPARVRAADYGRLIVEFEIAVELGEGLPRRGAPYDREKVAQAVGAVMPAFELADDRNADYGGLARQVLVMVADNAWNEGAVLGEPVQDWRGIDLAALRGVASIDGQVVGEGRGGDVMGHPFEALAWVANNLAARGSGLRKGDVVITGSLITSKFPAAGERLRFELEGLGAIDLHVD
jgi:2-keto-4-pentenoate hydratase